MFGTIIRSPVGAWTLAVLLASASLGCSDPLGSDDGPGVMAVRSVTQGGALDIDGYGVVIDGDSVGRIDVNDERTFTVDEGQHAVSLSGVAPNCAAAGPRTVTVASGQRVEIDVLVSCTAPPELSSVRILFADPTGIVAMNADGSDRVQLLSASEVDAVDISPDGARVVFVRTRGTGSDLWITPSDGSDPSRFVRGGRTQQPRWSPDGSEIVYTDFDQQASGGIRVTTADGAVTEPLTEANLFDEWHSWPSWSPDGSRIAFSQEGYGPGHIGIMGRSGDMEADLPGGSYPLWSPDDRIAYVAGTDIRLLRPDGSDARTVLQLPEHSSPRVHDWSPDARLLLYTNTSPSGGRDIHLLDVDAGTSVRLTGDGTSDSPVFWPDGRAQPAVPPTARELAVRDPVELVVDPRDQSVEPGSVSFAQGDEELRRAVRVSEQPAAAVVAQQAESAVLAVPYRGTLLTTAQVPAPPPQGCEMFLHTAQEGESTHLGAFTGTGTTCAYNGQGGVTDPPFNPGGGPPPYFVSDFDIEQTHVAADGDELWVSGTALFVQSLVDGSAGFVGSGSIEGGTGRFAGASGSFAIEGVPGQAAAFDGEIVLDTSVGGH